MSHMNNHEENSLGQQPNPDEETREDRELKNLLAEWRSPEPTAIFDQRVVSAYRRQFHQKQWWRRWLTGSIRLPIPAVVAIGLLLCATSYLAARKAANDSIELMPAPAPVKIVEVPVPVIQEKIVTRVVHVKTESQKAGGNSAPDSFKIQSEKNAGVSAYLVGFRPVSEIRIVISRDGEE